MKKNGTNWLDPTTELLRNNERCDLIEFKKKNEIGNEGKGKKMIRSKGIS